MNRSVLEANWKQPPMETLPKKADAAPSHTMQILIIDGDVDSADSLALMLQAAGHAEIRVTYSGRAALELAAGFRPSVVLLDLNLPDMNGYEVARLLHQHVRRQDMRLIALTGSGEDVGRERARAAGFERYLLKPVTAPALDELLAMSPH